MTTSSRCGLLDLMVNPVSDNPMGRARDQAGWWDQGRHPSTALRAGFGLPLQGRAHGRAPLRRPGGMKRGLDRIIRAELY